MVPAEPLTQEAEAQFKKMMTDPTVDPWSLDEAADNLQSNFPQRAAMLRKRAAELRAAQQIRDSQRGGSEFTIRGGDTASRLALHYTDVAHRWKEIPQVNPGMVIKTVDIAGTKTTVLHPWIVGTKVLLPLSWQVWAKKPPAVATGGAAKVKSATATDADKLMDLMRELLKQQPNKSGPAPRWEEA